MNLKILKNVLGFILVLSVWAMPFPGFAHFDPTECPSAEKAGADNPARETTEGLPASQEDQDAAVGLKGQLAQESGEALTKSKITTEFIVLTAGFVLILLLVVLYFLVVQPRKKRRSFKDAMALLKDGLLDEGELIQVEGLLSQALTAGLKESEVQEVRFALAFVRAKLKRYGEALAIIADAHQAGGNNDRQSVYLELWLKSKLEKHEDVIKHYEQYHQLLSDYLQSTLIAGIAYLHRGQMFWHKRAIDEALVCFKKIRALGVLEGEVPQQIDNHRIVYGLTELHIKNTEEGKKHFESAREIAVEQGKSTVFAELGLLLCTWLETDCPNVDESLTQLVNAVQIEDVYDDRDDLSESGEEESGLSSHQRIVRTVLQWHAISLLFSWLRKPEGKGLDAFSVKEMEQRINKVIEIDPDYGDAPMVLGLIQYFFANGNDQKINSAMEHLEQSMALGVTVPEVRNLVDRVKRLLDHEGKVLENYFKVLGKYLHDKSVPLAVRDQLKTRLLQFGRFEDELESIVFDDSEEATAPSVIDIQNRGSLLQQRIYKIVRPQLQKSQKSDAQHEIEGLLNGLERVAENIRVSAKELEETEQDLMLRTGEFLFQDDAEGDVEYDSVQL